MANDSFDSRRTGVSDG